MHDESGSTRELFLTFLQWARVAIVQASEDEIQTGMTLGMAPTARHGSCCDGIPIEIERENSVHEL
jgi:hypothetical protein